MKRNDPRIEKYFNFELTPEEEKVFLEEAQKHPETWEYIQFTQWMIDGIQDEGKAELKTFIANRIAEEKEESSGKFWYAAAAVVVTLVVSTIIAWPYLQNSSPSENNIASEQNLPSNNQIAADSTAVAMQSGAQATQKQSESNAVLEETWEVNPDAISADGVNDADVDEKAVPENATAADDRIINKGEFPNQEPASMEKVGADLARPLPALAGQNLASEQIINKKSLSSKSKAKDAAKATTTLKGTEFASYSAAVVEKHLHAPGMSATDSITVNTDPYKNINQWRIKVILLKSNNLANNKYKPQYQFVWQPQEQQYHLYLQDFGDQSSLIYRLDARSLYIEIQGAYFGLNLNGEIQEPKKVTDRKIIQALQ